jgi:hypothetical protein
MTIQVAADTQKDLIAQIAFWSQLPTTCPMCGAAVFLYHRQPQGYDYYGLRCVGDDEGHDCHECNFGQYKEGGGALFYKADSWREAWVPQDGEGYSGDGSDPGYQDTEAPPERRQPQPQPQPQPQQGLRGQPAGAASQQPTVMACAQHGCGLALNKGQHDVSMRAFGVPLCPAHQKLAARS